MKPLSKRIPRVIEILEELRPQIDDSYDRWVKLSDAQKEVVRDARRLSSSSYTRHAANDPALSWSYASPARILDPSVHQDLAVDLARKEMRRRRRAAGVSEEEEIRRRAAGHWDGWDKGPARSTPPEYMDDDELRRQMEATRRQLDRSRDYQDEYRESIAPPSRYHYPSINKSTPFRYERPSSPRVESPRPQPPRPPKEFSVDHERANSPLQPPTRPPKGLQEPLQPIRPPPRPDKETLPSNRLDVSIPDTTPALSPKVSTEPAKEKRVTFQPAAYLENGHPIRPVFLPSTLRATFLEIAADNTRQGVEMCGMLCGTQVNNALFISHLVIPEQRCTPDTCETENESGMLNYCIENDLIVIGWIHTHPTQSCFMSSRDLHTQAGYQVMMPESIAIVCAPRHTPS